MDQEVVAGDQLSINHDDASMGGCLGDIQTQAKDVVDSLLDLVANEYSQANVASCSKQCEDEVIFEGEVSFKRKVGRPKKVNQLVYLVKGPPNPVPLLLKSSLDQTLRPSQIVLKRAPKSQPGGLVKKAKSVNGEAKVDLLEDMITLLLHYRHMIGFLETYSLQIDPSQWKMIKEDISLCEQQFQQGLSKSVYIPQADCNVNVFDFVTDRLENFYRCDSIYQRFEPVIPRDSLPAYEFLELDYQTPPMTNTSASIFATPAARASTASASSSRQINKPAASPKKKKKVVQAKKPPVKKYKKKSATKTVGMSKAASTTIRTRSTTGVVKTAPKDKPVTTVKQVSKAKSPPPTPKPRYVDNRVRDRSDRKIKCLYRRCKFRTHCQELLEKHKRTQHKHMKFACTDAGCKEEFEKPEDLDQHILEQHNLAKVKCPTCQQGFSNKKDMLEHKRVVHASNKVEGTKCPKCCREFNQNRNLRRHMVLFHEEGVFTCSKEGCTYTANVRNQVKLHEAREHDEKVKCPHDGCEAMISSATLSLHLKRHYKIFTYRCSWPGCNKGFIDNKSMRDHMRIHLNVKAWKCIWEGCLYESEQRSNCLKHVRIRHLHWPYTRKQEIEQNFVRDPNGPQPQHYIERLPEHPDIDKLQNPPGRKKLNPAELQAVLSDLDGEDDDENDTAANSLSFDAQEDNRSYNLDHLSGYQNYY